MPHCLAIYLSTNVELYLGAQFDDDYSSLMRLVRRIFLANCQFIPGTDAHTTKEGEELARQELIDPTSGLFRESRVFQYDHEDGSRKAAVCGEKNGKNRNGAYTGFVKYIAISELDVIFSSRQQSIQRLSRIGFLANVQVNPIVDTGSAVPPSSL